MQERRNSIANALELRLCCTNPSIYQHGSSIGLVRSINHIIIEAKVDKDLDYHMVLLDISELQYFSQHFHGYIPFIQIALVTPRIDFTLAVPIWPHGNIEQIKATQFIIISHDRVGNICGHAILYLAGLWLSIFVVIVIRCYVKVVHTIFHFVSCVLFCCTFIFYLNGIWTIICPVWPI